MSADLLREAAQTLREKVEGALLAVGDERWVVGGLAWNDAYGMVYPVAAGPASALC